MRVFDEVTGLERGSFGFGTYEHGGRKFPGIVQFGGAVIDISDRFYDTHAILDDWERNFEILVDIEAKSQGSDIGYEAVRPLPPLAHPNILGGGSNYRKHVIEMLTFGPLSKRRQQPDETPEQAWARNAEFVERRAKYGQPVMWGGLHSAQIGARDNVILPALTDKGDWEMELAVVIGKHRRHASVEEARDMIAGYMAYNDMHAMDHEYFNRPDVVWQYDMFVKNFPTFKVTGPFIVPAAFINPVRDDIVIKLEVNGAPKQDWPVSDMIFSCEKMVCYGSERTNLTPGDLILTGSPPGNGSVVGPFLKEGDIITGSLTGLGQQRNLCVQEVLEPGRKTVFGIPNMDYANM